jgi:hypothetical protein
VTAASCAESASTHGARHYYIGMRDAFDALLRGLHDVPSDVPTSVYANGLLADLEEEARNNLLATTKQTMKGRRRESLASTVAVI